MMAWVGMWTMDVDVWDKRSGFVESMVRIEWRDGVAADANVSASVLRGFSSRDSNTTLLPLRLTRILEILDLETLPLSTHKN